MSPVRMNKVEAAIRLAVEYNKALNEQDFSKFSDLLKDDCVFASSSPPPQGLLITGSSNIAAYWRTWFAEHSNISFTPVATQSFGNQCVLRWQIDRGSRGRKATDYGPVDCETTDCRAASELKPEIGVDLFTVSSGKIIEILSYMKGEFNHS
ncbi:MAG: nuclear transport factor 2 family protein [Spirochaetales bacterium]|nr:nuclear transport factor 2 family protein [Spirochaetales bacterium]